MKSLLTLFVWSWRDFPPLNFVDVTFHRAWILILREELSVFVTLGKGLREETLESVDMAGDGELRL